MIDSTDPNNAKTIDSLVALLEFLSKNNVNFEKSSLIKKTLEKLSELIDRL